MKINNCKLCEIFDNQKLGGLNTNGSSKANASIQQHLCQHNSLSFTRDTLSFLPPHIRDMILATQILRGKFYHFIIFYICGLDCGDFEIIFWSKNFRINVEDT